MLPIGSASRWVTCPASAGEAIGAPPERSDLSLERAAAAEAADLVLDGVVQTASELVGRGRVDAVVAGHVDEFCAVVRARGSVPSSAELQSWRSLYFSGPSGCRVATRGSRVAALRLDYGFRIEDPRECWPLVIEAASAMQQAEDVEVVDLVIFHPRAWHPQGSWRTYTASAQVVAGMAGYAFERLATAERPAAPAAPSRHCHGCPRAAGCSALIEAAGAAYEIASAERAGRRMAPAELAWALDFAERAERLVGAMATAVRAEAQARIDAGELVPGWQVETGPGHREWTVPPAVRELATGHAAVKLVEKSPAEMEREGASVGGLVRPGRGKRRLARFDSAAAAAKFGG